MTKQRLVGLDATWLVHRCTYAVKHVPAEQKPRAVAHQVCSWLFSYALIHKAQFGFLAFDGPNCFRHHVYPLYKAARLKLFDSNGKQLSEAERDQVILENTRMQLQSMRAPDETYVMLNATRDLAAELGLPRVHMDTFEADDVLCSAATLAGPDLDVVIISKDKDMLQSLRPGVSQWYPDNDPKQPPHHIKHDHLGERLVKYVHADAEYWTPTQFLQYQVLVGDPTDSIPSILTPAKARKIINTAGSLGAYFKTSEGKQFYAEQQQYLLRNRRLVSMCTDLLRGESLDAFKIPVNNKALRSITRRPLASSFADYAGWVRMTGTGKTRSLF